MTNDLRFPTGRFELPTDTGAAARAGWIARIEALPARLREAVAGMGEKELATPYRPGGWTVRQVVHHVPDSHLNAYIRFKLALTESTPAIRPYDEAAWANLPDTADTPIEVSLRLLDALHLRWVVLLRSLSNEEYARDFLHPEHERRYTLGELLAMYAWHGDHHVAHVTSVRAR